MPRPLPFDTKEYTKIRAPVVDTSTIVRHRDGAVVTTKLDKPFLTKVSKRMNQKFEKTGDLSPIIIGHTEDGKAESDYQSVGFLHNYDIEPWENDEGEQSEALWADHWIQNENTLAVEGVPLKLSAKQVCQRWPRRSGEVWLNRHEIDPHCLLGATAPERPLGLLRLSKDGGDTAITYESPGDLNVAEEAKKPDDSSINDLPIVKTLEGLVNKLTQLCAQVEQIVSAAGQPAPGGAEGAAGAGGDPANDPELEQLLASLGAGGGGEGGKGEPEPKPKGDDKPEKLQAENEELKLKLARHEISAELRTAGLDADEATLKALEIQPAATRTFLISKMAKPAVVAKTNPASLDKALQLSRPTGQKKIETAAEQAQVVAHAQAMGLTFPKAASELGFVVG